MQQSFVILWENKFEKMLRKKTKPSFVSLNSNSEPESGSVKVDGYMSVRRNLKQAGWVPM